MAGTFLVLSGPPAVALPDCEFVLPEQAASAIATKTATAEKIFIICQSTLRAAALPRHRARSQRAGSSPPPAPRRRDSARVRTPGRGRRRIEREHSVPAPAPGHLVWRDDWAARAGVGKSPVPGEQRQQPSGPAPRLRGVGCDEIRSVRRVAFSAFHG